VALSLERGWLAERQDHTDEAIEGYQHALGIDPNYAAAMLRLGYMLTRKGDFDRATNSFRNAERIFQVSSEYEGAVEAEIGQANMLIRSSRAGAALPLIDKALTTAQTIGSPFLVIRLELLKGVIYRSLGPPEKAEAILRQAIGEAEAQRMDNLASSGLVDLGNLYMTRRDLDSAEQDFLRALDVARRGKVRRHESRALLALGSICEQSMRPAEARRYIEASLPFYKEGGYRREVIQANSMMGGVLYELARFDESIRVLRGILPDAVQFGDRTAEAQVRERLADSLRAQGDWPKALAESQTAAGLFGSTAQSADVSVNRAWLQWKLGRESEALHSLAEAEQLIHRFPNPQSDFLLAMVKGEFAYDSGRLPEAASLTRQALAVAGTSAKSKPQATALLGLVLIRQGRTRDGLKQASDALDELDRMESGEETAAGYRLPAAVSLADAGEKELAFNYASTALRFFGSHAVLEALWRNYAVLARVTNEPETTRYRAAGRAALDKLKAGWPDGDFANYRNRPSIHAAFSGL
jgi:tetratricopeptide (TPR) repeat protein